MNILLAEGDSDLADALITQLRRADYTVHHAPNGPVADYLLMKSLYDLVILDLDLPMLDGLTVLKRLHTLIPSLRVLALTASDGPDSRLAGVNAGADDCITKPLDFRKLEVRLRYLRQRVQPTKRAPQTVPDRLTFEHVARRACIDGVALNLTPREWNLLDLLFTNLNQVVTKEQIARAWGTENSQARGGNSIPVYVHRLRRKIQRAALVIRRVHGIGYVLEAQGH